MPYVPKPLDTKAVTLPQDLLSLTEYLAENTHDIWAAQRMVDGWRYGAQRDDAQKLHPCLVPYADLPESEKDYDRNTAMETLKAIVALGYGISKE
ncbi:MAG: RyR domain-containing protein [Terracidiphilus sp.]